MPLAPASTLPHMDAWVQEILQWLALPQFGLSTLFVIALVSATLVPMGSEPAVVGLLQLNPDLFWQAIAVATAGNTLGGAISWWMGLGAHKAWQMAHQRHAHEPPHEAPPARALTKYELRAQTWLRKWGAKTCLLSWLPLVGDPLCAVAGWLKLPFWQCVMYMAIGKFLRYLMMTIAILWALP